MIICPICNKEMKCINKPHLKKHDMTVSEFKSKFINFEMYSEELKLKNKESSKKGVPASKVVMQKQALERQEKKLNDFQLLNNKCKYCNSDLPYRKENLIFCNRSCSTKYNNKNRTVVFTKEGKEKQRLAGAMNVNNFKKRTPAKIYNVICQICSNSFETNAQGRTYKTCSIECRGKLRSKHSARENNTYGKSGYYQGIYCASSWELAFLIYHKDLGKSIIRCPLTFTYYIDNIAHTYFPDFIMDNIIYEIKGLDRGDVEIKTQSVIDSGYKIQVIRKKEISPIIKEIKEKYKIKDITKLYDKITKID